MNPAHPAKLRDDELRQIASAIFAGPLPCDPDERRRQAAILDELAARPAERTRLSADEHVAVRQLVAQLRGNTK